MGRYAAGDSPAVERLVEEAIAGVGAEVEALHVPRLRGVVLGGGYGRGEGGVTVAPDGTEGLSNDLDFYTVAEDGADGAAIAAIGEALAPVSKRWSDRLRVEVDFCEAKTPWRMRHDQERLMIQELVHGYFDVAGLKGEELFRDVARLQPSGLPWMEAARLLMNRGMGWLLAGVSDDPGFIARNLNKCVLGAGDALLIARHRYQWKAIDRAEALGDPLYRAAVEWKFRPRAEAVCDRKTAREKWFAAYGEAMEAGRRAGAARRSAYQAARWALRRRTLGNPLTLGQDCVLRVLDGVARAVSRDAAPSPSLLKDWQVFN